MFEWAGTVWAPVKTGYKSEKDITSLEDAKETVKRIAENEKGEWMEPCDKPDEERLMISCPYKDALGKSPCTYPGGVLLRNRVICPKYNEPLRHIKIEDLTK